MIATSTLSRRSTPPWRRFTRLDAWSAATWYLLLTVVLTWPVCANLASRLPNDLGDPLFGCWLLHWNIDHLLAIARGDVGAIGRYWNATFFYPAPLALLYSEHLFALGVQALPLWLATHNLILCYNLILLSTFVLAGVGTFLLVRDLTGSARAAFLAGLFYAFSPYRFAQLSHIQVLSSQWMPFVLFGLHRYFERCPSGGRREAVGGTLTFAHHPPASACLPLALAAVALVAQNLSCGYYMVFFAPFVAAYVVWEIARRGLWHHGRVWVQLGAAASLVAGACLPFVLKYEELRLLGFSRRSTDTLLGFSADTSAYLRGISASWLWPGGFTTYNRPEGQLFPGLTPVLLAAVALACLVAGLRRRTAEFEPLAGWRLALAAPVALIGVAAIDFARFELFAGRMISRVRHAWPWLSDIRNVFVVIAVAGLALAAISPRARAVARLALSSRRVCFTAGLLLAVWLSFGPVVTSYKYGIAADTLYGWMYRHVPGFDGLRVPARYAMLAMLFLAVLGGYGAAALERASAAARQRLLDSQGEAAKARVAYTWALRAVVPALALFFLFEAASMPLPVKSIEWPRKDGAPGSVSAAQLDRLYTFLQAMPPATVVAEFPFGGVTSESRAVYLSIGHGHRTVNGYSGGAPAAYDRLVRLLADPVAAGDPAWQAILDSGATCLVVHEWAFARTGPQFCDWLQAHGARPLATFKSDRLFEVPR